MKFFTSLERFALPFRLNLTFLHFLHLFKSWTNPNRSQKRKIDIIQAFSQMERVEYRVQNKI
jgi:hypothetical protein